MSTHLGRWLSRRGRKRTAFICALLITSVAAPLLASATNVGNLKSAQLDTFTVSKTALGPVPSSLIAFDDFNRVPGPLGIAPVGGTWATAAAIWNTTATNSAAPTVTGQSSATLSLGTLTAGETAARTIITAPNSAATINAGLVFRDNGIAGLFVLYNGTAAGGNVILRNRTRVLRTIAVAASSATNTLGLSTSGRFVTLYWNGQAVGNQQLTVADFSATTTQPNTNWGLHVRSGPIVRFDDFEVKKVTLGP